MSCAVNFGRDQLQVFAVQERSDLSAAASRLGRKADLRLRTRVVSGVKPEGQVNAFDVKPKGCVVFQVEGLWCRVFGHSSFSSASAS